MIESRVKPEVRDKLTSMGHMFRSIAEYTTGMGRGQAVLHDTKTGVNYGASDPRADGSRNRNRRRCSLMPGMRFWKETGCEAFFIWRWLRVYW